MKKNEGNMIKGTSLEFISYADPLKFEVLKIVNCYFMCEKLSISIVMRCPLNFYCKMMLFFQNDVSFFGMMRHFFKKNVKKFGRVMCQIIFVIN